ncbi:TPA: ABC transporter ATP-binding protein [Candidatus Latescibacteria bacterium]|nr:ABC transporter ATP-binding protein [Candidatus Latescibacterota bacterium]
MASLHALNLSIGYAPPRRDRIVVGEALDVSLRPGELVCLLGPNGAGKSTLMRTLSGTQSPLEGRVEIDGTDIHALPASDRARQIAIVLTDRVDAGHLTTRTLVALGRYPHTDWMGALTAKDIQAVENALADVGATEHADAHTNELSDGERQKVMIARALAQDTDIILLDEPTAFLDLPRRVEIMTLLRRLAIEKGKAILLSTHDLDLAIRSADRLWLMNHGRIQRGIPEALVMDGTFASTFDREGVSFDPDTGAFRIGNGEGHPIGLEGEGREANWTARALERIGYTVAAGSDRSIVVRSDGPSWELHDPNATISRFGTLEDLLNALPESERSS